MKTHRIIKKSFLGLLFLCLSFSPNMAWAAGLLTPKGANLPTLEIKDHKVNVVLEDGYAVTTVEQVFYNPNTVDLEAIYSFPVPQKGAVSEFTMWIDGKPISGEVLEKKQAREIYEQQKEEGKNAGLTEKDGYKTFDISVYPVRAGQETKIRLSYIQPAHVDTGMGSYLYPLQEGGVDDLKLSFWEAKEVVSGTFSFDLALRTAYPVDAIRLPNHPQAQITQNGNEWSVHLDNLLMKPQGQADQQALTINNTADTEEGTIQPQTRTAQVDSSFRLDTDIVVYYRHADNLPGSVDLVAYKTGTEKRGTFMLTVTPGMDLKPITEGRDWIFVLDVSGSMQGKYATLAEGVRQALERMSPNERFRIILFNDSARELSMGFVPATEDNVKNYMDMVKNIQPDKGTNLYAGLEQGLKCIDADRTTSILLVTDGVANVGETHQKKFIELLKNYDIRLFTFIMGNSANEPLLNVLTKVSDGFALSISNSDDIVGKILLAMSKVNFGALHGAKLRIEGIKTFDLTPEDIGSLYRGQQLVLFGHYYGAGPAKVTLEGKISGEQKAYTTIFDFPVVAEENPELERLWAYAKIEDLTEEIEDFGEDSDTKNAIRDLGVEYGLVTDYTSMIVLEEDVFQKLGIERNNASRLKTEYDARQARANRQAVSRRVDMAQPMFQHNQPTTRGGAGAIDPWYFMFLLPFFRTVMMNRKKQSGRGV